MHKKILLLLLFIFSSLPVLAADKASFQPPSLWLEELTWPEVRDALAAGYTRILIPTGGVEQGGYHVILGKHNKILRVTAAEIAAEVGHTLIAPVMAYVPEQPHMAFPSTISLSDDTFKAVLSDTALSLARHGFTQIYFLGESGGNQLPQQEVAEDLADEMAQKKVLLASLNQYYDYTQNGQVAWLEKHEKLTEKDIGFHVGVRDTSEMLVAYPEGVRLGKMVDSVTGDASGGEGKATLATPEIGKKMLELKVKAALKQIAAIEKIKAAE